MARIGKLRYSAIVRNSILCNRRHWIGTLTAAIFGGGAAHAAASKKPAELNLTDLEGQRVRLRDHRGKIVVLNFWATWCGPCQHEMPLLVAAEKEYRERGIMFIGASLDDAKSRRSVPDFVTKHGVTFPVWTGATGDDLAKLALGEAAPATAFIDQEGLIVARISGEMRKEELDERLLWLLAGRKGLVPQPFVSHL